MRLVILFDVLLYPSFKMTTSFDNFNHIIKGDIKEHYPNWLEIPDHLYRILITGGSGSGETNNTLF